MQDFPEPVKAAGVQPLEAVAAVAVATPKQSTGIRLAGNKYPLGLARRELFVGEEWDVR